MKCHSDFYEKLKSTLVKTETTGGQTMPANSSLVEIPQSECVEEVTVFESFCNVSCVAAYANISIPTVSNFSVFSGPSPASRAKMSTTVRPKTQVSRRSPSRVHWDSDITTISDTEHYTSVLTSSSKDKRMKRKRMDASESSPDEVSIMKVTSRKSAKLESGAQSPTYVNLSSSESVSDDTEVTPTVKRHSISPTLTGRKYRFPLHSELSARDRSLRAGHSRSKKVVTIEISSDEDMVDEEEPYTIPETQLASESRKLIKTMESSISKPRSRTAHPVKPAAVSLLDKGAIQKAQAIIEAWRSSSYEVVPDEIDFSAIESTVHSKTAASKSRRSLFSSTDSIPTSADLSERPESSQSKTPRARTQRHTRTLPSKETNMTDSVQETAERSSYPLQKGDIFLTPKNPRHKNSGEGGTPSSQSTAPFKSAESSQKTYHTETSARLSSSESHDDSQIHRPRAGRPRKMTEPLAAKEIDSTHPSKSGGNIPHSKRDTIRSSEPRDPSADRELEKAPEAPTPQRGLPSTNLLPSSETQRVAESLRGRGKDRKKLAESVGVKGLDSARGGRSASPASSPEQGGQRSPEARTNLSGMHSTSRLSSSETQDDSLTQKLRGRGRRKLTESAGAKLPRSARPTKSAKSISHEKVDRTSESPASSPERMPRKSQGKLSSQEEAGPLLSQGVSSLRTQNDSQARRPRECTTSSKLTPKNLAEETSKGRKQDKPRRTTSSDGVDPNFSLEPESHGQKAKVKEHTELRGTSDAARKGSGSSKSESRKNSFCGSEFAGECVMAKRIFLQGGMAQIIRAEDLLLRNKGVIDPFNRLGCNIDPVIVVVEFCQVQGPRPLVTVCLKTKEPPTSLDIDNLSVWLMSCEAASGTLLVIYNQQTGIYAMSYYTTIYDIRARAFQRPICVAVLSSERPTSSRLSHFSAGVRRLVSPLMKCNRRYFMRQLSDIIKISDAVESDTVQTYYTLDVELLKLPTTNRKLANVAEQARKLRPRMQAMYDMLSESRTCMYQTCEGFAFPDFSALCSSVPSR
ncbi:hypothetical protein COOONC_04011 [Cooperia oncophora]